MASRWAALVTLAFAFGAASTLAQPQVPDSVTLLDENNVAVSGAKANGVLTWWGVDQRYPAIGDASVNLGELDSRGAVSQLVAFSAGHPPALKLGVTWSSGKDVVDLKYSPVIRIPIKFWILCAQVHCDLGITAAKKERLARFLVWANTLLLKERAGIEIIPVDDDPAVDGGWIADKTTSSEAAAAIPLDFDAGSGNGKDGDCPKLKAVPSEFKRPGAFNVYMVDTVSGEPTGGDSCWTDDSAVIGRAAIQGTILHELCHDLSLEHIDLQDWATAVGGEKNLMHSESGTRKYLTEGQVFRMHFSKRSGLNGGLSSSRPQAQAQTQNPVQDMGRDCENAPELTCPPQETILWPRL